jgi:DNA modification methylase
MRTRGSRTIFEALGRHAVHPFPARMAPEIVCSIIKVSKRPLKVLDPMMGSGTVVALAQSRKHQAFGIDIDPLAALITEVWTSGGKPDAVRDRAADVLKIAKRIAKVTPASKAYPVSADAETRTFIRYWFDCRSRRQLIGLSTAIGRIKDQSIRKVLLCALSRLIIAKRGASRALDLVHSRPHRYFDKAPVLPFSNFLSAVEAVLNNVPRKHSRTLGPRAKVSLGDARRMGIKSGSIDLVLTSPPYLNAIDYMRCSKFSLVWMGYTAGQVRALRAESVGTEIGLPYKDDLEISALISRLKLSDLPERQRRLVAAYIADMRLALQEVARVLVPRGRAVYVVGENTIRGVYVRNAKIIHILASRLGLRLEKSSSRPLPSNRRYLPPPTSGVQTMDARMSYETILQLRKVSGRSRKSA